MADRGVAYDAIVLAGGQARRFGSDKLAARIDQVSVLDHCLQAVADAARRVVVGPRRDTALPVLWTREDPPGTGPVPAIAAGLALVDADWVVVLAGDMPSLGRTVTDLLHHAVTSSQTDTVVAVDHSGHPQPLTTVWRRPALDEAVARVLASDRRAAHALLEHVHAAFVPVDDATLTDIDTPSDLT